MPQTKVPRETRKISRRGLMVGAAAASVSAIGTSASVKGAVEASSPGRTAKPGPSDDGAPRLGPVVETSNGNVRGYVSQGIHTFRGLRYGAPTGGANRFKPPSRPEPWNGVMETVIALGGNIAPQVVPTFDPPNSWSTDLTPSHPPTSEDCLFLNLFTPGVNDGAKRPVMVFLHGGAWQNGAGVAPLFDGTHLARRGDAVIIAINHRLNFFGFLYLGEALGEDYLDSGNAGVLDIIASLQWVRDNIANFGGDPGNVTIFGWSSGGSEVSQLLAMPAAKGLFHKAIIQSGAQLTLRTREEAVKATDQVLAKLGLSRATARQILDMPVDAILKARSGAAPTFDGRSVPRQLWTPDAPPTAADVPIILGGTDSELSVVASDAVFGIDEQDAVARVEKALGSMAKPILNAYRHGHPDATPAELLIFIATGFWTTKRTVQLAERKVALGGAPLYLYRWEWRLPSFGGKYLSPHGVDLPFVWDNLKLGKRRIGDPSDGQALADRMSERWLSFARAGTPNGSGLAKWKPYTLENRSTMVISGTDRSIDDPHKEERLALEKIPDSAVGKVFSLLRG
jgi:para-nitrobenzyl esterase